MAPREGSGAARERAAASKRAATGTRAATSTRAATPVRRASAERAAPRSGGPALKAVPSAEEAAAREAAVAARHSLWLLLAPTAILTVLGLVMILSAGSISAAQGYGTSFWYFNRQVIYAAVGLAALVVCLRMPYRSWSTLAPILLLAILPLMVIAWHPVSGTSLYGASRWIDLGPVTLQPAEFAKLGIIAFAAAILARKRNRLDDPGHLLIPLAPVVLVFAVLVILQRDLGTTVIICGSVFLLMFAAGVRMKFLAWTGVVGLAVTAYLIFGEAYRRTRFVEAWLDPGADPRGAGFQLIQGLIAFGSGGWFGVGIGNSRQKWDYLPNAHSDFIFAIIGEELGLLGALVTLAAFVVLLYAGIRIAMQTSDPFGRLLASGITGWIGLQTIINMGAVTGLLPITGVPLPLVSFGGTALVVTLAGVGVIASVARATVEEASARAKAGPATRARPQRRRKARS
jgi:cell division protein FtsW